VISRDCSSFAAGTPFGKADALLEALIKTNETGLAAHVAQDDKKVLKKV
jgi:hypothetical protein